MRRSSGVDRVKLKGDGSVCEGESSELRKFNSEREGGIGISTEVEGKEGDKGRGGGTGKGLKGRKCDRFGEGFRPGDGM